MVMKVKELKYEDANKKSLHVFLLIIVYHIIKHA